MLDQIIANIPADPTTDEVADVLNENVCTFSDYTQVLGELLSYGMPSDFEDKLMELLAKGVKLVNDDAESDMFGFGADTYETMMEDADMYAL